MNSSPLHRHRHPMALQSSSYSEDRVDGRRRRASGGGGGGAMGDCCCDRTASRAQAIMKKVPPCTSKSAFNPFLPCFLRSRSSRERLLFKRDRTTDIMRACAASRPRLRPSVRLSVSFQLFAARVCVHCHAATSEMPSVLANSLAISCNAGDDKWLDIQHCTLNMPHSFYIQHYSDEHNEPLPE